MKKPCFLILLTLSFLLLTSCNVGDNTGLSTGEVNTTVAENTFSGETNAVELPAKDGSFTTELYFVTNVDGICYLNFVGGNDATGETAGGASTVGGPLIFADMDEMYHALSEGALTDDMAEQMKRCFPKTEQGFLFPNLDQLHVPVLPEGLHFDGVGVEGAAYYVEFFSADKKTAGMAEFLDKSSYDSAFENEYTGFANNKNLDNVTIAEGEFLGIPCTVIEYRTSVSEMRALMFTVEGQGVRMSVLARYCLSSSNPNITTSDMVPYGLRMYCESHDGIYALILIPDMDQALSLEWLQTFGTTDFIPEAVE